MRRVAHPLKPTADRGVAAAITPSPPPTTPRNRGTSGVASVLIFGRPASCPVSTIRLSHVRQQLDARPNSAFYPRGRPSALAATFRPFSPPPPHRPTPSLITLCRNPFDQPHPPPDAATFHSSSPLFARLVITFCKMKGSSSMQCSIFPISHAEIQIF